MTIATVDDIVACLAASAKLIPFVKNLSAPKAAGAFQSRWLATGNPGAGSAAPAYTAGAGYTCDMPGGWRNSLSERWVGRPTIGLSLCADKATAKVVIEDRI